jgi:M6 family metalloprotease-like protein
MKKLLSFTFLLMSTTLLYAVPANPEPVVMTQPDGRTVTVFVRGDERIHWYESIDGYTLLFNKAGYLSYAQLDEKSNLQPTDYIVTDIDKRDIVISSFLHTLEKNLFFSESQVQLISKVWEIEDSAMSSQKEKKLTSWDTKTICAFVQFPEKEMVLNIEDFEGLMNHLGYTSDGAIGSVKDYFNEISYGLFSIQITLCGIYTAPQSEAFYAGTGGTNNVGPLARFVAEKVAADPNIDLSDYDNDGDGFVDGFHIIFAGCGKEAGGSESIIWSHKSSFEPPVSKNGKKIQIYSCSPELRGSSGANITTIGVICHEMMHAIGGIRDYYDTNGSIGGAYDGTGNWDLMASGSWNGNPSGNCPPHPNMHIKVLLGWVMPYPLSDRKTVTNMPNSAENNVAYRINTATYDEYYLMENRQKIKFDQFVPGEGLLIYHVHQDVLYAGNCINCTHPQRMYLVSASRTVPMPTGPKNTYGNINSIYCPFPSTGNFYKTTFADFTIPAMKAWNNSDTKKPISNIKNENHLVSFEFMDPAAVGIFEPIEDDNTQLFVVPNPANEYVDLRCEISELRYEKIEFFNIFRQLVKSVPFIGDSNGNVMTQRIPIADLSNGFYFIKVGNQITKLVVE